MDPISAIVAIALIIQILKKGPEVAGDMLRAAREAWDNAEHRARIKKLMDAGVAPATRGGAAARYFANLWRTAHLDAENRRAARAAKRAAAGKAPSWWQRKVAAATSRWRDRNPGPAYGSGGGPGDSDSGGTYESGDGPDLFDPYPGPTYQGGRTGSPQPGGATYTTPFTDPDEPRTVYQAVVDRGPGGGGWREPAIVGAAAVLAVGAGSGHPAAPPFDPTPLAVSPSEPGPDLTLTALPAPTTTPLAIGGTATMSTTVDVTGVSSGAAAARSLAAAIQAATEEYVAQLAKIQQQLQSLAEQSYGGIGLGGHSAVIGAQAQANEAMAAATGMANRTAGEVIPLFDSIRRAFVAIH